MGYNDQKGLWRDHGGSGRKYLYISRSIRNISGRPLGVAKGSGRFYYGPGFYR